MKKITGVLAMLLLLSAFTRNTAFTDVKELTGYKLSGNTISHTDYNLWVVTNKDVFCRDFSPVTDAAPVPDFETEWVLAGKIRTLHNFYAVRFTTTVTGKDYLNVYFKIKRDISGTANEESVDMISVPKGQGIKRVNFYHDKVLVRSIPIVSVY